MASARARCVARGQRREPLQDAAHGAVAEAQERDGGLGALLVATSTAAAYSAAAVGGSTGERAAAAHSIHSIAGLVLAASPPPLGAPPLG